MIFNFAKKCDNCDLLRELLEAERASNKRLLDMLVRPLQPQIIEEPKELPEPIQPRVKSFRMQREIMEQASRQAAKILQDREREMQVNKLEKEVGLADDEAVSE